MAQNHILKVVKGNVEVYNLQTMNKVRTVYKGGDATIAQWYDEINESVSVQLHNGKVKIINKFGNIIRTI